MKRDPFEIARTIAIKREINEAAERWLVGAFRQWWEEGGDPHQLARYLRFPSARRVAEAERNRWLNIIAEELPEHQRAATLKRLVDCFMAKQWPAWSSFNTPPDEASDIESALFFAATAGAVMSIGRHQLNKIIKR